MCLNSRRLDRISGRQLLDLRFCDLRLQIEGSPLEERIAQLYAELDTRGSSFAAFLAVGGMVHARWRPRNRHSVLPRHPRLAKLELNQMLEVEGGDVEWCMRIMRHEAGHAIENAFAIRRRPQRQRLFGKSSVPYPDHYSFQPYSKSFVVHLGSWYAQSHPDEDFAETFAVWLTPGRNGSRGMPGGRL